MHVGDATNLGGLATQRPRATMATAASLWGALLPVAFRVGAPGPSLDSLYLLDALVTTPLAAGTYLAFRYFPPAEGYTSTSALSVGFPLPRQVGPGDVLRLQALPAGGGTALLLVQYGSLCEAGSAVSTTLATTTTSFTTGVLGWSCFLYAVPAARQCCARLQAIAAVAAVDVVGPTGAGLPPQAVLPCQFTLGPATALVPAGAMVALPLDAPAALPGAWRSGAWQTLKYATWGYDASAGNAAFTGPAAALEASLYIAPTPGALVPIAFRPHFEGVPGTAQLAVVATTTIPAGTRVYVSGEAAAVPVPYWLWTAPTDADVPPGTVILWSNLSVVTGSQTPAASIGTMQYVLAAPPPTPDPDLTEFTVFTMDACVLEDPLATSRFITAVYTCARRAGVGLPPGLTAGTDMPAAPWPAAASILPLAASCCALPVALASWPCVRTTLSRVRPCAWSCQQLPAFSSPGPCGAE